MISLNNIIKTKLIQITKDDKNNFLEIKNNDYIYPAYYYTNKLYYSNKYNTNENTIIFLCGYKNVGDTFILNEKSLIFWPYYSFYIINNDFNYKYVYYCLKFIDYNKLRILNTNRQDTILLKDIKNIEIPNITMHEQQEIIKVFDKFEKIYFKIEKLNYYFKNFDIFNYFKNKKINILEEILNLEYSLIQNKIISNTLINSTLKNIFEKYKYDNFILLKNIFSLNYCNKINNDNNYHICLNYINDLNYLQIKYIKYNIPLKNNVIIFLNKDNNKYLDEFIFYYLLIKKHKLIKTVNNLDNHIKLNLLNNFKIPLLDLNKQQELINIIHHNLYSVFNNIDLNFNILSNRLNNFINNNFNEVFYDDNLFFDLKLTFSNLSVDIHNFNDLDELIELDDLNDLNELDELDDLNDLNELDDLNDLNELDDLNN